MRARRTDDNQKEIVKALIKIGCSVAITSGSGDGFPDLVVGYRGKNYLIEVKDGNKPPSQRKLTPVQVEFHKKWTGQICVVKSIDEAIEFIKTQNEV